MSGINHGSKQHMSATELKAIQRKKRKLQKEKEAATTAMEEEAQEGVRRNESFLIYNDNNNRTSDNNSNRRNTMNQSYKRRRSLNANLQRSISMPNKNVTKSSKFNRPQQRLQQHLRRSTTTTTTTTTTSNNNSKNFQTFKPKKGGNTKILENNNFTQHANAADEDNGNSMNNNINNSNNGNNPIQQLDQLFGFLNGLYTTTNNNNNTNDKISRNSMTKSISKSNLNDLAPVKRNKEQQQSKQKMRNYKNCIHMKNCPIDYSLKERIRFVSKSSMDWAKYLKMSINSISNSNDDDDDDNNTFVNHQQWEHLLRNNFNNINSSIVDDKSDSFYNATKYYMYPSSEIPPAFLSLKTAIVSRKTINEKKYHIYQ